MKKIAIFAALLAGLGLLAGGLAWREPGGDNVVARYEGGTLTVEDLEAHRKILSRKSTYREKPEALTPEFVFDHAVNMEMIIAKGLKEKLHLDPRIRAEIHDFMSGLFLKIMQDTLVTKIDREQLTEEEVRAYFNEHIESYRAPALYGIRIIRHDDPKILDDLRRRIGAGEETFESAAAAYSTDEASRDRGGDIGKRSLNKFRPEWRAVIEKLVPGEVSGPVEIKGLHYLFELTERTDPPEPSFEAKKDYVRNDLLFQRYREAWRATYDKLRQEFDLELDHSVLQPFLTGEARHEDKSG